MTSVIAIDFGAGTIRVSLVDLDARPIEPVVVHRYTHAAVRGADGTLRWDWPRLVAEMRRGLDIAIGTTEVASVGFDTWGVDYGLIDSSGVLVGPPHSYRSARTANFRDVVDRIGERRLYEISGVQLQPFNTIFQLAAHDRGELERAAHLLLLPDLLVHGLTGHIATEMTAAGTTGLLDIATRDWCPELIGACGAPKHLFSPIVEPGTIAGRWNGMPVIRVGGHDTASAIAATSGCEQAAFVATGTWMLVGRVQSAPDVGVSAQADNFTNEIGVDGSIRFLKNLAGFWLFEECRRKWGMPDADVLDEEAADVTGGYEPFDTTDPRFLAPEDMEAEIRDAASIEPSAPRATVVRAITEAMAHTAAGVIEWLGGIERVDVVGGGAGVPLLVDALERHTGRPVTRGPREAATVGNALVQGIALGVFDDLDDARQALWAT